MGPKKKQARPSALANALAGVDLDIAEPELEINVTTGDFWYYGLDGKCPSSKYDLVSVILHEMAHGLGFMSGSYYDEVSGFGRVDLPTPFDAYAQLPDGRRLAGQIGSRSVRSSTNYWFWCLHLECASND